MSAPFTEHFVSPHSELTKLGDYGPAKSPEVQDRIDRMFNLGIWAHIPSPDRTTERWAQLGRRPARTKMRRGFYRKVAWDCLRVITGDWKAGTYYFPVNGGHGQMDVSLDWLLKEIMNLPRGCRERNFLTAIAKDAGVYPAPKWWKVTRRLQGLNASFRKTASLK